MLAENKQYFVQLYLLYSKVFFTFKETAARKKDKDQFCEKHNIGDHAQRNVKKNS